MIRGWPELRGLLRSKTKHTARTVWAMSLADLRKDYTLAGLAEKDLAKDPFRQFEKWFQEAQAAKVPEPNAMVLATAARDGAPSAREEPPRAGVFELFVRRSAEMPTRGLGR